MLVASQPGLMATLGLALPSTHQALHNIAKVQGLDVEWSKVCVHFDGWMLYTNLHGFVSQNTKRCIREF